MTSKDLVVRQSNHLIEAQYKLSLVEKRFVLYLTALVTQDDADFQWYNVDLEALAQAFPTGHKDLMGQFERVSDSLMKRVLHVQDLELGIRKKFQWLAGAEFDGENQSIRVSFHPDLKPYLLKLKSFFTSYTIGNVSHLRSAYAVRLYELLKQYEKIGKRSFLVDDLQSILGAEYPRYPNFKQRVLSPSVDEICANTDIHCSFKEIKKGRKVLEIQFFISTNARSKADSRARALQAAGEGGNATKDLLVNRFGFAEAEAAAITEEHAASYIRDVLEVVEARVQDASNAGNAILNITAYTRKALEQDWRPKPGSLAAETAQKEKNRAKAEAERRAKDAKDREQAKQEKAAKDVSWASYEALPEEDRKALRDTYERALTSGEAPGGEFILNQFRAVGLDGFGPRAGFRTWLAQRHK